jgi:predicted NUDIX family phosphoesterase
MKPALVIKAEDTPKEYKDTLGNTKLNLVRLTEEFWSCNTHIADRAICETDNSLQQLIPYVVLVNENNKIFCYSRGKGGGEERLYAKLSIGLGGHVDSEVPSSSNLKSWLVKECERELLEEVGYVPKSSFELLNFCALLSDQTNSVGQVHLGILAIKKINTNDLIKLEEGVIEDGEWLTFEDLKETSKLSRLENWSVLAIQHLDSLNNFYNTN